MELGRYTNEAAKTVNSKGLFAGLDLTGSRLWDADDFNTNHEHSLLRQIRWILVIKKEARMLRSPHIDSSAEQSGQSFGDR